MMMQSLASPLPSVVEIEEEARWFRVDERAPVDLTRRRKLRMVLMALVRERLEHPEHALSIEDVVARAWPGEKMLRCSARARVHVAILALRNLGLRDVLVHSRGYFLDARIELKVTHDATPPAQGPEEDVKLSA